MSSHDRYPPRYSWTTYLWPVLLLVVLGAVLAWRFWPREPASGLDPNAAPRAVRPRGDLAADEKTTIAVFHQTSPSVVHITTMNIHHDAFSTDLYQIPRGTGSGFVWDQQGMSSPTTT
jgi:hypothetical protein